MPALSLADLAALSQVLFRPSPAAPFLPLSHQVAAELHRLYDIFKRFSNLYPVKSFVCTEELMESPPTVVAAFPLKAVTTTTTVLLPPRVLSTEFFPVPAAHRHTITSVCDVAHALLILNLHEACSIYDKPPATPLNIVSYSNTLTTKLPGISLPPMNLDALLKPLAAASKALTPSSSLLKLTSLLTASVPTANSFGWIYLQVNKGAYGLPQSGRLANDLLRTQLAPHGYLPCCHTPGFWRHTSKPISFVRFVDDFAIQFVNCHDVLDLQAILQQHYNVKSDWTASTFCGTIYIDWDYVQRTVQLSMPGYIQSFLDEGQHPLPQKDQHSPHPASPIQYGTTPQLVSIDDTSPPLSDAQRTLIPKIIGNLLYYACAVDSTLNVALSSLSSEQNKPPVNTKKKIHQLLDHCATHPTAKLQSLHLTCNYMYTRMSVTIVSTMHEVALGGTSTLAPASPISPLLMALCFTQPIFCVTLRPQQLIVKLALPSPTAKKPFPFASL